MIHATQNAQTPHDFIAIKVLKPKWGWIMLSGLVTVVFGFTAFWMPLGAVYAMTLLFGAYAMADGILSIGAAMRSKDSDNTPFWPLVLRGILGVFAGAIVLILPGLSAVSLVAFAWAMMAIWSFVTGAFELGAAIRLRKEIEGEWMLGVSGLISLGLGIAIPVVLLNNPAAGLVTMGWMIGFYALMHGVLEMALAWVLRKLEHQA